MRRRTTMLLQRWRIACYQRACLVEILKDERGMLRLRLADDGYRGVQPRI